MMKHAIYPLFVCTALALGSAAHAQTDIAPVKEKLTCSEQKGFGDVRDISCTITASGTPQHFRFKANFSGSHDDTTVTMSPALNSQAIACAPGSNTELIGEDGDVSLECKFSLTAAAGTNHILRVLIKWSHAQYTDFEFVAE